MWRDHKGVPSGRWPGTLMGTLGVTVGVSVTVQVCKRGDKRRAVWSGRKRHGPGQRESNCGGNISIWAVALEMVAMAHGN